MVEIDHGMGVRTRYGHLRRTVVKKGQRVELRQKIGEMGTSGRSTGTHLHYEVLVGGKPRNPMKFFQAGEYVLKGF
jgi:murein DD-endopeptidase MepM/ murein hydrolase activator NlpD